MKKCTATKPFEYEGRTVKPDDQIDLHPVQAESLRLQGKVKINPVKATKAKKK